MSADIDGDYEAMRSKRTLYHSKGQVFDAVDTICAIRSAVMEDSSSSFYAVTESTRNALPGDGSTPERFARLVDKIGEKEAWTRVYVAAWAAVDPRVESQQ